MKSILLFFQKNKIIAAILLIGLIYGLVYVFIIPEWQHYDEPGNFEYAWLIAHRPGPLKYGDYDLAMRRAVLSSLIDHGFFDPRHTTLGVPSLNQIPPWIGETQVGDPPLYYWLVGLPMRLLPPLAVGTQLYAGRLVSLLMYLLTILAAWGLLGELLPPGHALRWMVTATLALLPGFTDIMTSLNSDVGAVLFYTLFLWACLRMMRRGLTLPRLVVFILAAAACIFTKKTVYMVVLTAPLGLLLALVKGRWQILVWAISGLAGVALVASLLSWDDPASWYRITNQEQPGRIMVATPDTLPQKTGGFALQTGVNKSTSDYPMGFSQVLPRDNVVELAGKTVTIAGWMWASAPIKATTPMVEVFKTISQNWMLETPVTLSETPTFFVAHYDIPAQANMIVLTLSPQTRTPNSSKAMVYYTDLILVAGNYPADQIPQFANNQAEAGTWGGRPFTNLLNNASMQSVWPRLNGPLASIINKKLGVGITSGGLVSFILDLPRYRDYALLTFSNNFRTFWAKFSCGQVALLHGKPYRVLGIISLIGILGACGVAIRYRRRMPWGMLVFLGVVGGLSWVYTLLIGIVIRPLIQPGFITGARYAFPAIVPTALVLNAGWWGAGTLVGRLISRKRRLPLVTGKLVFFILFLGLDIYSLITIIQYFR